MADLECIRSFFCVDLKMERNGKGRGGENQCRTMWESKKFKLI